MTQHTVANTARILVLLIVGSLLWTACSPALTQTNPALPPGFLEAQVPSGELAAYLYLSQGTPIGIPTERFVKAADIDENLRRSFVIPHILEVSGLSLWTGSSLDSFAGTVQFRDEATLELTEQLLRAKLSTGKADLATLRLPILAGAVVPKFAMVQGTSDWAKATEASFRANQGSPFKDAVPVAWDLLHLLPETPPEKPVAVGFVHVNEALMSSLASKAGLNLSGIGQAFGAANVSDIAFIAYADTPLVLPAQLTPAYFKEAGLGAIFVARSTYPGFVLSFFLGSFSDRVGLEKGPTVKGKQVLVKEIEGAHLMIATLGNTFFVALAPTRDKAEELMTSALAPHVKG